jgi:hypothetical protein
MSVRRFHSVFQLLSRFCADADPTARLFNQILTESASRSQTNYALANIGHRVSARPQTVVK